MTRRDQRLWYQVEKIRHRKMGWGQITWVSKFLLVTPNHQAFDSAVADFLIAVCVRSVEESTG